MSKILSQITQAFNSHRVSVATCQQAFHGTNQDDIDEFHNTVSKSQLKAITDTGFIVPVASVESSKSVPATKKSTRSKK